MLLPLLTGVLLRSAPTTWVPGAEFLDPVELVPIADQLPWSFRSSLLPLTLLSARFGLLAEGALGRGAGCLAPLICYVVVVVLQSHGHLAFLAGFPGADITSTWQGFMLGSVVLGEGLAVFAFSRGGVRGRLNRSVPWGGRHRQVRMQRQVAGASGGRLAGVTRHPGLPSGIAAYLLWGLFPLYFVLFARSGALEVVAHRAIWSLVFCLFLLAATRSLGELREILADRRVTVSLAAAGLLIATNWSAYVYGVATGRTLDAALGYFINPLAVTALGVLVLKERLRPGQWLALAFGAAAVVVLVVGYGEFPYIALTLALTFGTYSLVKKIAGRSVAPTAGLAMETAAVLPFALGYLIFLAATGRSTVDLFSGYGLLMMSTGVVTAIPLLLFAASARKVSLITLGMLQYIAPVGQFLLGWLVFHEPMPASRWAGFVLVWAAIVVFAVDIVAVSRRSRVEPPAAPLAPSPGL